MADMAPKKKHHYFGGGRGVGGYLVSQDPSDNSSCCSPASALYSPSSPDSAARQSCAPNLYDASSSSSPSVDDCSAARQSRSSFYDISSSSVDVVSSSSSSTSASQSCNTSLYETSLPGSSTRQSSPGQGSSSPFDYSSSSLSPPMPYHPNQSTYHAPYQGYHHPSQHALGMGTQYSVEMPKSPAALYGRQYGHYVTPPDPQGSYQGMEEVGDAMNGELPSAYATDVDSCEEPPDPLKSQKHKHHHPKMQKRPQRCRMCANHGKTVDMKGHKWYCRYRDCECNDCEITRMTQFYMKERQKLTRHQQQQQQQLEERSLGIPGEEPDTSRRRMSVEQSQLDFPRKDEMIRETKDILDYTLLAQVDQVCRPKSSNMHQ